MAKINRRVLKNKGIIAQLTKSGYLGNLPIIQEEKTRRLTILVLTLITIAALGIFAINPTISTILRLRRELSDSREVKVSLEQKIENLSALSEQYAIIQTNDLPYIMEAVPSDPQVPLLAAQIQQLAQSSGIELKTFQAFQIEIPRGQKREEHFSFAFSLSAAGDYQSILSFITRLSNFQRVVSITNFNMAEDPDDQELLNIDLRGNAYVKQ